MPSPNGGFNGASSLSGQVVPYNKWKAACDKTSCSVVLACVKVMGHAKPFFRIPSLADSYWPGWRSP